MINKEQLRKSLNVPEGQRIGQWIYNCFRETEKENGGIDTFYIDDETFIEKIYEN